jgi:predicted RNA-binding Zn-ribbon protein involved in translation (DUF1610 family)
MDATREAIARRGEEALSVSGNEPMFQPKENVYVCPKCGQFTVTVDIDEGTTPFMLRCRASGFEGDCNGMAVSQLYPQGPRPANIPEPAWEWYKPSEKELRKCHDTGMREHARLGGLFIRRRDGVEPASRSGDPKGYYRDQHGSLRKVNA